MHIDNIINSVLSVKASENVSIEDDLKSDSTKTIAELIESKQDEEKSNTQEENPKEQRS